MFRPGNAKTLAKLRTRSTAPDLSLNSEQQNVQESNVVTFQSNMMKRGLLAAGMVATMTAWGVAEAATSYSASASGSLSLNLAQPEDLGLATLQDLVVNWETTENILEDSLGGTAVGDAAASGGAFFALTGPVVTFNVDTSATGSATATTTKADSFTESLASLAITITNNGATGYTIFGDLTWTTASSASFDDPVNEYAFADATMTLQALGAGNLLATTGSTVDFFIAAGATETLYFEALATGVSESFPAPVPVPASLPLLASALLGGSVFARRARA